MSTPIAPITPGASTPLVGSTVPSAIPSLPLVTSTDNQSSYSSDIANGTSMSIVGFSGLVLSATNEANETAWAVQQNSANVRNQMYNAAIANALDLIALFNKFLAISSVYTSLGQANQVNIDNLNSYLSAYNAARSADIDAVNQLNAAVQAYNDGTITQADLQTAINTYNAYAATRNLQIQSTNNQIAAFNATLPALNAQITILNQQIGSPQLKTQDPYTGSGFPLPVAGAAPATPPAPMIIYHPANLVSAVNDVAGGKTKEQVASALFQPYFSILGGQFEITSELLQQQSSFQGFVQYFLSGTSIPSLPAAFYNPTPNVKLGSGSSGSSGAGSGVSLASIVTSLSSPFMESIISQGIFLSNSVANSQPISPRVVDQIQYLSLQLLSQIGLQSGSAALRLLEGRLPFIDLRSSPVALGLGLTILSEIGQVVDKGGLLDAIKEILTKSYPGISAESLNSLAEKLAGAAELFMLQAGLVQLAQTLGTPQLPGEILASLPSARLAGIIQGEVAISTILQNAGARQDLISEVANKSGVSSDVITQSLNASTTSDNSDVNDQNFTSNLVDNGVDQQQAIITAEILRTTINSQVQVNSILNQSFAQNRLSQSILANDLVQKITDGRPDITNRQLRDELANQFVANGATQEQALATATTAVTGVYNTNPSLQSLSNSIYNKALSGISGLGLNESAAQAFAREVVSTVVGPNIPGSQTSVRELIDQRLQNIFSKLDTKVTEEAQANLQNILKPTLELYAFAERLRDPANTFLFTAQTGLMYAHPEPSNFKASVDIAG